MNLFTFNEEKSREHKHAFFSTNKLYVLEQF